MAQRYDLHGPDSKTVLAGACCAFGVFDGVHEGHRYIIDQVVQAAMHDGRQSVIITFDIDPDELFAADRLKKLMTNEDRLDMLGSLGADAVFVLPFDRQLANQEPTEFLQSLFGQYVPASLHVGQDIRFGRRAQGAIDDLRSWGELHGMHVVGHQLLAEDGSAVTSTRIRRLLGDGEVQEAAKLLCRPYCLRGTVEGGRHEGRQFGFRTANLHVPDQLRAIGDGVYACYATIDQVRYKAAVSVGVAPTFQDETSANIEAHILDFSDDIYGQDLSLEFMYWLRPMTKFDSTEQLIATVTSNITWVRDNLHL